MSWCMNTLSPFLAISSSCNEALQVTKRQLAQAGLRSVQTFDLHAARLGLDDCPCPNHGTEACDCQLVILLVYGEAAEPLTLILHGNDGQTWVSVAESPSQPVDQRLVDSIRQALESESPAS